MHTHGSIHAAGRLGAAATLALAPLLFTSAARADDPELDPLRRRVERAETEQRLREREAAVKARRQEMLDGAVHAARRPTRFSRRGRIVFPELVGYASSAPFVLGPGALGGVGVHTGVSGLLTFGSASLDYGNARGTSQYVGFNPSLDYFIGEHLTLGMSATATRSRATTPIFTTNPAASGDSESLSYTLGLAPRIGRTIDVGPVTLWPKLGVGYGVTRSELNATGPAAGDSIVARTFSTELTFDTVLRLGEYVTFTVGPVARYRRTDLSPSTPYIKGPDTEGIGLGFHGHLGVTLP